MSKRPAEISLDEPRKRVQVIAAGSVAPGISRWSYAEIADSLPPLPSISPELEEQVFRHPGLGGPNWERLEWYGDAVLEMISTELIFETFPHLPAGRCSQIREQIVCNRTLAGYYRQYGMDHKTQLPADFGKMTDLLRTKKNDRDVIKLQGDVFESYVGAVVKSHPQGFANAVAWLKMLWGRTIKDQIKRAEKETIARQSIQEQPEKTEPLTEQNAKNRLNAAILVPGVKIRYEDMPCKKKDKDTGLPLYAVGVYLDGWGETNKFLGLSSGKRKTEAGGKAALQALENRQLMKVYEAKKKQWLDERKTSGSGPSNGPETNSHTKAV
ncbi:ribonuclease iii [Fusarium longipes]|uniref:Ribonuclease iii n=1 Tax=Fusarium longipes TaxID=694270 RepID=A0A395T9C2_9HYPO|nr:ribonuclease iii [Fusarium longipes]